MCGIAFLYDRRAPEALARQRMQHCLAAMQHRGPDDGHVKSSGNALLGHRRLSIIDIAGSPQPMADPTNRYLLSYNGEIYNYATVRNRLEKNWRFTTHGDTEVLLAGLILEGSKFLDHLEGMWAFAFWDSQADQLLLGRDRMGKKPLFFQQLPEGGIACASELPALRKLSNEVWHEDEHSTADYLRYGYVMPGYTAWKEVQDIPPGHIGYWQPGNELELQPWWELHLHHYTDNEQHAITRLYETIISAVERRMVADVEVGAFLSGGIDSTLVSGVVRKILNLPLKTFTIGFQEAAFDERYYAKLAADDFGTNHHEKVLTAWDETELERLLLNHVGQPFADASLLPTAMVSSLAAKQVKVALSGDGGDELFSGYQRYQARTVLRWYTRLPKGLQHLAEKAIQVLPEPMAHHSRSIIKKAHLFMDIVRRQHAETPYFAPLMFSPEHQRQLAPGLEHMGHSPPKLLSETVPDDIARMMYADALIYLPQDILVKVDRASMAHSLETRAPFLDRQVVELAFSLPRRWHRRGFRGKRLLVEAFDNLIPKGIKYRRKQGFGVPIHDWFRGKLGKRLLDIVNNSSASHLSSEYISSLLTEHQQKKRDHGYRLWLIYTYLLWRQQAQ